MAEEDVVSRFKRFLILPVGAGLCDFAITLRSDGVAWLAPEGDSDGKKNDGSGHRRRDPSPAAGGPRHSGRRFGEFFRKAFSEPPNECRIGRRRLVRLSEQTPNVLVFRVIVHGALSLGSYGRRPGARYQFTKRATGAVEKRLDRFFRAPEPLRDFGDG
jgi:hypothetical protein